MDSSAGICCITQSYLERAKSAFEDFQNYESLFGAKPNFVSPTTLVPNTRSSIKRYLTFLYKHKDTAITVRYLQLP